MPRFPLLGSVLFRVFGTLALFRCTIGRTIRFQLFRRHRSHTGIVPCLGPGFVACGIAFVKECVELLSVVRKVALLRCAVSRLSLLGRADMWSSHKHLSLGGRSWAPVSEHQTCAG